MALEARNDPAQIKAMFADIARRYDLNNRLHSLFCDQAWRRKMVRAAGIRDGESVLDVACGTGDVAAMFAKHGAGRVVGLDFCGPMLEIARRKSHRLRIEWIEGDAMAMPFADREFDIVVVAFGLRNMPDLARALCDFRRVLKPGGRLVVLEFHPARRGMLGRLLRLYLQGIMPRTAAWIAHDRTGAYRHLADSVQSFVTAEELAGMIAAAGFEDVRSERLTFGVAAVHRAVVRALS
ncbi:MAG: bifunctional demethylmenaquinone methyltransferase/2-methoxy-6-polyprenyl-1,4-benzoquinol methylase UbiE [Phycisphaerae bacterium]